jgi:hypothetical protein
MFKIQCSSLLKVETKTARIPRVWISKESKDDHTYTCVRKYKIFVDQDKNSLHEVP